MCEPHTSALSPLHRNITSQHILSDSLQHSVTASTTAATGTRTSSIDSAPVPADNGGMLQTPYTSALSSSSCEDSPSPLTPANSDSPSSVSPLLTPSPNIHSLSLAPGGNDSDSGLCAPEQNQSSIEAKAGNNALVRHPEVVLTMEQPGQPNSPQSNPQNTGKGGCWTCRIRRKKCDEQRTDNSCQTCIRLRIDCLGWGPKRPAWMRDKQAVETYKAGIKEKLIKAGMVRGQPRLTQSSSASRSSSHTSGPTAPSGSASYDHSIATHRSMSGPAAFGGLGGMGSIDPMGAFGGMGGPMHDSGMSFEFNQQHFAQQPQPQPHNVRYGPYPTSRALQGFRSAHHTAQQAPQIPQGPAVMGGEFDYLRLPNQFEQGHDQQYLNRRSSFGISPSHQQNTQHLDKRRHSLGYSSSPSLTGGSPSSHGNSPYISGHNPFGASTSGQGPYSSLVDFPFGSGDVTNTSPELGGMAVSAMNNTAGGPPISSSPLMIHGDESLLFPTGGTYGAPQSRSSSSSASGNVSGPSRSSSTPGAVYTDPLTDPALVDPHVQYYFDSVMPMQYGFASGRARGALQNLFSREPYGPLVNASCALAAQHNKTIRVARLLDPPDADPQQSTAQQFFNRAFWQLGNKTVRASDTGAAMPSASYAASDALASLHLVAYFLLQGGAGDWEIQLNLARNWLAQSALCAPENEAPMKTLALMGEAEQLAAKMIIWYDIFAAISQQQSPRFLEMCRRLFGHTITREGNDEVAQTTNMIHFMGCPDDVLLILGETAALAQWKAQERQLGSLSNRELLRRSSAIEDRLLVATIAESTGHRHFASVETSPQVPPTRAPGNHSGRSPAVPTLQVEQSDIATLAMDAAGAAHPSSTPAASFVALIGGRSGTTSLGTSAANAEGHAPEKRFPSDVYQHVGKVFLHTASLYLASVINEPSPSVPEINNAVNAIISDLANLTDVPVDRMLALPLMLAGCMTDKLEQRQFIRSRLSALDEVIGNVRSVRLLMERVWVVRDTHGGVVEWYDVMRNDFGVEVLLV